MNSVKIYGPYLRKDGRKHVILYENGNRTTVSYPKYVMENHLGRKLKKWETVDHINGDYRDDSIENLQVLSLADNARKGAKTVKWLEFRCPMCYGKFSIRPSEYRANQLKRKKSGPFCSKKCAGRWGAAIQNGHVVQLAGDNWLKPSTV